MLLHDTEYSTRKYRTRRVCGTWRSSLGTVCYFLSSMLTVERRCVCVCVCVCVCGEVAFSPMPYRSFLPTVDFSAYSGHFNRLVCRNSGYSIYGVYYGCIWVYTMFCSSPQIHQPKQNVDSSELWFIVSSIHPSISRRTLLCFTQCSPIFRRKKPAALPPPLCLLFHIYLLYLLLP